MTLFFDKKPTDCHGAMGTYAMWWRVYNKSYTWLVAIHYHGFHFGQNPAVTDDFGNLVEVPR